MDATAEARTCVHWRIRLGEGVSYRWVKNDERGARDVADQLRMRRLLEACIAPLEVRELLDLVRHRARMVHLRSSVRC